VDFTPAKALTFNAKTPGLTTYAIIPTFNHDGLFYSQSFFNPYDGLDL
jgi:hypothetical protein